MLWLSELLLQNPEIDRFDELTELVRARAKEGERFFRIDVKPPYPDTPANWEFALEGVFTEALDALARPPSR